MKYPKLVPSWAAQTPVTVTLYREGVDADGAPVEALHADLRCSWQDSAKTVRTAETSAVQLSAVLLYDKANGKVLPGLAQRRMEERALFLSGNVATVTNVGSKEEVHDMDILKLGAKGQQVIVLQHELTRHGYKVAADGVFGAATENAVKAFQKALGLVADGVVGQKTWAALLK